jgi:DNA-binding CsgD family transcriptional regulator/PAS domain-containing protein
MGASQPILLEPACPAPEDPTILECLRLVKALSSAAWVELSLEWDRAGTGPRYLLGNPGRDATTVLFDDIGGHSASLRLGSADAPDETLAHLLRECLSLALENRRLAVQAFVLRAALDTAPDHILLFDDCGNIVYANPPADALLSLQTEDQLLAVCDGYSRQPLFTLLCRLVENNCLRRQKPMPWAGSIHLEDGREFTSEVFTLDVAPEAAAKAVMVRLKTASAEPESLVEDFGADHRLSPREQEVLNLLVQGQTTHAMADRLGISPHTIRDHLKHLYRKTGTGSRSELLGMISRKSKR